MKINSSMSRGLETDDNVDDDDNENAVVKRRKITNSNNIHTNRTTSRIFAPFRARISNECKGCSSS